MCIVFLIEFGTSGGLARCRGWRNEGGREEEGGHGRWEQTLPAEGGKTGNRAEERDGEGEREGDAR